MINRIGSMRVGQNALSGGTDKTRETENSFGAALRQEIADRRRNEANGVNTAGLTGNTLNFSRHALARVEERGIELTPGLMEKLSDSVGKAQEKGAKNILAFDATRAFIINIPYGRVITAMSQEEMRENIFTNIDGAVLL